MSSSIIGGNRYANIFIDEFSGYAVLKFMKYKTQELQTFEEYVAQYGRPKILRIDNGTEYKNKAFKKFCMSKEIARKNTVLETPEQNGVAERFNRIVRGCKMHSNKFRIAKMILGSSCRYSMLC